MLLWLVVLLILLSVALIVAGLWSMLAESTFRRPNREPLAPSPAPITALSRRLTAFDLGWRRPFLLPPMALTNWYAQFFMIVPAVIVLGLLALVITWFIQTPGARLSEFPLAFIFVPIVGVQGLMFTKGLLDWRKLQALNTRGQLASGFMLDRWVKRGRSTAYCVAYYFELPWGSAPVVRAEINDEAYHAYQIGNSVSVRYLPEKPQVCRLEM